MMIAYSSAFLQLCLGNQDIQRLIAAGFMKIDTDSQRILFKSNGPFKIKPISFDDDSDMPIRVIFDNKYHFVMMLDDAIHYGSMKIENSVQLFAHLLISMSNPDEHVKLIIISLFRFSLIRIETKECAFVSAPFSKGKDYIEVPGVLIRYLGKSKRLM